MSTLFLTDSTQAIVALTLSNTAALGKTPNEKVTFLENTFLGLLDTPLDKAALASAESRFKYEPSIKFPGGAANLSVNATATCKLDLIPPSVTLMPADIYGDPIPMGQNYYVALTIGIALDESVGAPISAFTLKQKANSTGTLKLYVPFARGATGSYPLLREAIQEVFSAFVPPSGFADMSSWRDGAVMTYDAAGDLEFDASVNMLALVNPTATTTAKSSVGPLNLNVGPSVTLSGKFTLSGEFQTRFWKISTDVCRLGSFKKREVDLAVNFDAEVSAGATLLGFDPIAEIYKRLDGNSPIDAAWLAANNLTDAGSQVKDIYKTAVQTKLSIGLNHEAQSSNTDSAGFSFDFDESKVRDSAPDQTNFDSAFKRILAGDLSVFLQENMPPGVVKRASLIDKLKDIRHTFVFNFLGVLDYASVTEFAKESVIRRSDEGDVVVMDMATARRMSALLTPMVSSDKLRSVLVEQFQATLTYQATLAGAVGSGLKVQYFQRRFDRRGDLQRLADFVQVAGYLDVPSNQVGSAGLDPKTVQSSAMTTFLQLTYDNAAATKLFLDDAGNARTLIDYQICARKAFLQLPAHSGDPVYKGFVEALTDDGKWKALTDAGAVPNIAQALGADPQHPGIYPSRVLQIIFWSKDMYATAVALQALLAKLQGRTVPDLLSDTALIDMRSQLAKSIASAVEQSNEFGDYWAPLVIHQAAHPQSEMVSMSVAGKALHYAFQLGGA